MHNHRALNRVILQDVKVCSLSVYQDLSFTLKGLARLLNNPLIQTYLPRSTKKIQFYQELLILFWKFCDFNKVWRSIDEPSESYKTEELLQLMQKNGILKFCMRKG